MWGGYAEQLQDGSEGIRASGKLCKAMLHKAKSNNQTK